MNFNKCVVDKMIQKIPPIVGDDPLGVLIEDGDPQVPIYFDDIESSILDVDNNAEIKFGMSKLVVVAPSLKNIVIKIPFSGTYDFYYGDDYFQKKNDIIFFDGFNQYNFIPFEHARTKQKNNYCQVELEKYNNLFDLNLEDFVAETQFYKTLENGLDVYIQEKVFSSDNDPNWENRHPSLKSKNIARKWFDEDPVPISGEWIGLCIDTYGEGKTKKFLDYCNYVDPIIISDAHSGNIGYRLDGTPCILDYSGFED